MQLLELMIIIVSVVVIGILALILERRRVRRVAEGKAGYPTWVSILLVVALALIFGSHGYDVINEGATGSEIIRLALNAFVLSCGYRFIRKQSVAASA